MDGRRFDLLTKAIATRGATRRGLLGLLAGGVAATLGGAGWSDRAVLAKSCAKDADCPLGGNGEACCGGVCTNVQFNPAKCGDCTTTCKAPKSSCCASECVDLKTSHDHCGKCVNACHAFKEDCCGGTCRVTVDDPKNCGQCDRTCKPDEACCGVRCVDPANDPKNCGKCDRACKADEVCLGGKCVKEHASAGPPPGYDLVAACVQPTDPGLAGDWRIVEATWTDRVAALAALPPELQGAVRNLGGAVAGAVLTLGRVDTQGTITQVVKSALVRCADAAAAQAIAAAYAAATANRATPLAARGLPANAEDTRVARYEASPDPDLARALPGKPAVEVTFHDGTAFGLLTMSGTEPGPVMTLAASLIGRLVAGATPGGNLVRGLVYVEDVAPMVDVWYSRLGKQPQRRASVTDDQWARQQATEGDAVDFAHASQTIPSTESGCLYTLSTWAGRFADAPGAQAWLAAIPARLATQNPDTRLSAITEADGLGEASLGFLYTLMRADGVVVGVDLYARVGAAVSAVGLSVFAGQMTPGVAPLFADARPLGKGAQTVLRAQLTAPDPARGDPRGVAAGDVFGDSPLPVATPGPDVAGGAGATTFTACTPTCGKRAVQDQTRPYQVWCPAAPKCNEATTDGTTKCSCNLFRQKKKATSDEWYGKQNEKKEYDPDTYDYSCKCGHATTA